MNDHLHNTLLGVVSSSQPEQHAVIERLWGPGISYSSISTVNILW